MNGAGEEAREFLELPELLKLRIPRPFPLARLPSFLVAPVGPDHSLSVAGELASSVSATLPPALPDPEARLADDELALMSFSFPFSLSL